MITVGLKKRFLAPLITAAVIFFVSSVITIYLIHERNLSHEIIYRIHSVQVYYEKALSLHLEKLSSSLSLIGENREMLDALKKRNRDDIATLTMPIYKQFHDEHNISFFNLHDPHRVNIFMAHQPSRHGNLINRFTMLGAEKERRTFAGMELDPMGRFSYRAVRPLYEGGTLLGYVELGEDADHIVENMGDIFEVDLYLLIKKEYLNKSEWERGMSLVGHEPQWDQLQKFAVMFQTSKLVPLNILNSPLVENPELSSTEFVRQSVDDRHFAAKSITLKDAGNREVGSLVVVQDITSLRSEMIIRLVIFSGSFAFLGALIAGFFYFILERIESDLVASQVKMLEDGKKRATIQAQHIMELRQKQEELLIMKEKAEEANRLKSDFLNTMSHELRTPLTVMLGNMPFLTDLEALPEPDEIVDIAQDVEDAGKHLLVLINDLLDISKIEAGKMALNKGYISVTSVLENAISTIKVLADKKGITVDTEIDDMEIVADMVRLKQILLNLLSNAVKFTDKGGITVKVNKVDEKVHFKIIDTGCGMKEESLPFIFDVFRQVDGSSTRAAQGTGLGLAITKKLIELHEGEIKVKSEVGLGTTFDISLPIGSSEEGL